MKYKALAGVLFLLLFTAVSISAQTPETRPRVPVIKTGVLNKKAISPLPAPVLPSSIDRDDLEGSGPVNVEALIDVNGKVISAKAISGHPLLRRPAEEAALKTMFRPTLINGPPINVSGTLVYDLVSFGLLPKEKPNVVTTARVISHLRLNSPLSLPKPRYPEAARAVDVKGPVNVKVLIDEKGNVISAKAVSGHPLLRAAAVNAARRAKFRPTIISSGPVRVWANIVYNFR